MHKISVIIPSYNSAHFLPETLESVFAQTYKNLEIIVIDDGSTDNTEEAIKPYLNRVTYIKKQNAGPASARNLGLQKATGEFGSPRNLNCKWRSWKKIRRSV